MKEKLKAGDCVLLPHSMTNGQSLSIGDDVLKAINLISTYSHSMAWRKDGTFIESHEAYTKAGKIDGRRSRYYVNGKRVGRDAFNVLMWGKKK